MWAKSGGADEGECVCVFPFLPASQLGEMHYVGARPFHPTGIYRCCIFPGDLPARDVARGADLRGTILRAHG